MPGLIENPEEYFRQFVPERDQLLIELEEEARKEKIPIVGPIVGELLHILARATQAERILDWNSAPLPAIQLFFLPGRLHPPGENWSPSITIRIWQPGLKLISTELA